MVRRSLFSLEGLCVIFTASNTHRHDCATRCISSWASLNKAPLASVLCDAQVREGLTGGACLDESLDPGVVASWHQPSLLI